MVVIAEVSVSQYTEFSLVKIYCCEIQTCKIATLSFCIISHNFIKWHYDNANICISGISTLPLDLGYFSLNVNILHFQRTFVVYIVPCIES